MVWIPAPPAPPEEKKEEKKQEPEKLDESPATAADIKKIGDLAAKANMTSMDLGKIMATELKWKVPRTLNDLKKWQVKVLTAYLEKAAGK